jgi:hypothetical protein
MKSLLIASVLFSGSVMAQDSWTETYKIPQGITYRARMAGFDCGEFGNKYVSAPSDFIANKIQYRQLAADKDLNIFLIEATYPSAMGESCLYGVYLDRNRDDKTLDFNHSIVSGEGCEAGKEFLDHRMSKVTYEGSKRGLRYIATQVITDESNDVCESGNVRAVFDRRF